MINAFSGLSEQLNRGGTEVMNIISDGREVLVQKLFSFNCSV